MNEQSERLADRYRLIPLSITQDNILQSDSHINKITNIETLSNILDDRGSSYVSSMSILSHLNPYTPNRRIALIHSTGTGKTRKALLAALQYNRDITIVAVHNIQSKPFITELASGDILNKIYPGFNKRLDILTCRSIMTAVTNNDYKRLDYFFRDRVIIVDEVHHVRSKGDKKRSLTPLFSTIINILSSYRDSVVMMLTATPLVDDVSELVGLYTLLKGSVPPESNYNSLVYSLSGYISKLDKRNLPTREIDVKCLMVESGEQWRLYQKHQNDRSSVYAKTSAIGRFITKDDAEASECDIPTSVIIEHLLQSVSPVSPSEYHEMYLRALESISVKHYMLIKNLREYRGHPHFVFDIWKKRGGIDRVVDVLTMPMIGYTSITTEQEALDRSRGLKLLALHKVASKGNLSLASRLLDIYNSYDNRDGSLIDVLLATPKFAESMSVRTAKYKHSLNCFWNLPGKHQVDGRINRRTSLQHEPRENRVIYSFNYILYNPDGSDTVESSINEKSEMKYSEIRPILEIMNNIKLENHYTFGPSEQSFRNPIYPHNTRINNNIRMHTPIVNYRCLRMDTELFLSMLESHTDLFNLMGSNISSDEGYTKLVSVAIQAIESMYIKKTNGEQLTEKQNKLLVDVSAAFVEYNNRMTHMLYFINSDTVEYQRMNTLSKRVLRSLTDGNWSDITDQYIVNTVTQMYNNIVDTHVDKIYDKWCKYGYYITKYILSSCHRLVEHRDKDKLVRSGLAYDIDNRKLSRGAKWQSYNKSTLIAILRRLNGLTNLQCMMIHKRCKIADIFKAILDSMNHKDMVLTLPL
jgi:superfamily II DNA or RNA helicase